MSETHHTRHCPNCGCEIPTRAKLGQGTQKGKYMKLNTNRQIILDIMNELNHPIAVIDLQKLLKKRGIQRVSKKDTGWNYHTVQAELSNMIGMGQIKMVRPLAEEEWCPEEGFTTDNVPHYQVRKHDDWTKYFKRI